MKPSIDLELPGPGTSTVAKKARTRSNYYVIISIWAMVIVLAGFTLTYVQPMISRSGSFRPLVHTHAFLYFLWMVLFIVQPLLVRLGYTRIHKKLGIGGLVLAGLMIIFGVIVAITGARLNSPVLTVGGFTAKQFLIVPMTDMLLFTTYFVAVLVKMKDSESHKRLIILMTLSVIPAAVGRITGIFGISNFFLILFIQHGILFAGIINDLVKRKRIHLVYVWGGLLLLAVHFTRFPLGASEWWSNVANWLVD
ncbi:MAG TPA: hypothetical protein VGD40_04360 [Chryseosolibacter sp.]